MDIVRAPIDELDRHVAAIFDAHAPVGHWIRLSCECGRTAVVPLPGSAVDVECSWRCPLCGPEPVSPTR